MHCKFLFLHTRVVAAGNSDAQEISKTHIDTYTEIVMMLDDDDHDDDNDWDNDDWDDGSYDDDDDDDDDNWDDGRDDDDDDDDDDGNDDDTRYKMIMMMIHIVCGILNPTGSHMNMIQKPSDGLLKTHLNSSRWSSRWRN